VVQLIKKLLEFTIIFLLIIIGINPIIGSSNYFGDATPPVTTISFNPPEPDGENGWYVSNVTVILNASDDLSGVNITKYRVKDDIWQTYLEPFILDFDGEDILIEFYSIDNAGNQEEIKSVVIDIDKTKPWILLTYEVLGGNAFKGWFLRFTVEANDPKSGMDKVEFYNNKQLQVTINGSGPIYQWIYYLSFSEFRVVGLICNPRITDEYVKFFAISVIILGRAEDIPLISAYAYDNAGNNDFDEIESPCVLVTASPGIYLFKRLTLPNNYEGDIGKFFVKAWFYV
jgi:hypothetical protein